MVQTRPVPIGEKTVSQGSLSPKRFSFLLKIAGALALILAGDLIFYQREQFGGFIGLFALAWVAVTVLVSPALRNRRSACGAVLIAALVAGALVFDPSLLAWTLFWTALSMAALLPATDKFDDGWRWFQRLLVHGVRSIGGPITDVFRLHRTRRGRRWGQAMSPILPTLALPAIGGAIILTLFAIANPVISDILGTISWPIFSVSAVARLIFWAVIFMLVWGTMRPRRTVRLLATFDGSGDIALMGVNPRSVTLSLILFNALFVLQNVLDIAYLWGGLPLPQGMTLAEYAHRGAYPLIATALLTALFVLVILRPGSQMAASRGIRRLLILWIAQNVFLVCSTILRTIDYVDAYSLTRLRIAALAWMALVAIGLVLICWRILRGKSASWLINGNLVAAGLVLLGFCFVDTGNVAAAWNVRHAREVGGRGAALDLCYLNKMGGSALLPLIALERSSLKPDFAARVRAVRQHVMADVEAGQADGGWTWRNARRLLAAHQQLGDAPATPVPGMRDCAGRIIPPPPPPEPDTEATPTSNSRPAAAKTLTVEPQR